MIRNARLIDHGPQKIGLFFSWLALIGLLGLAGPALGQVRNNYAVLIDNAPYVPLATADSLVGTTGIANQFFLNIPTKMPFPFNGRVHSLISLSSNGHLIVGGGTADPFGTPVLNSARNNVVAFTHATTSLREQLQISWQGTAPNRQMILEWRRAQRSGITSDTLNYQIMLHEDGRIVGHYGPVRVVSTTTVRVQYGLKGTSTTDVVSLQGSFPTPTESTLATGGVLLNGSSQPVTGWRVRFIPSFSLNQNIAARALTVTGALIGCPLSAQSALRFTVENAGANPIAGARLQYRVGNGARVGDSVTFPGGLAPGQRYEHTFSQRANLSATGNYTLTAFAIVPGDGNRNDDSIRVTVNSTGTPRTRPTASVGTFATMTSGGWISARGTTPGQAGPGRAAGEAFITGTNSAVGFVRERATPGVPEWFYLANVAGTSGTTATRPVGMRFLARAMTDTTGRLFARTILDDTLDVVRSLDCGASWQLLARYTQADLEAGRFDPQTLTTYNRGVEAAPPGTNFSVAFVYRRGTQPGPARQTILLDNMNFITTAVDAGIRRLELVGVSRWQGCGPTGPVPVRVTLENYGPDTMASASISYRLGTARQQAQVTFPGRGLAPGQQYVQTFSGMDAIDITQPGRYQIVAQYFPPTAPDGSSINDSLSLTFRRRAPREVASVPTVNTIAEARGFGTWHNSNGYNDNRLDTLQGSWGATTINGLQVISFSASILPPDHIQWLYLPNVRLSDTTLMTYQIGVVSGTAGTGAVSTLGDDTLTLQMTADCGATWQVLARFSQANLASVQLLNGQMRSFTTVLPERPGQPINLAWRYSTGGTVPAAAYRWIMTQVGFSSALDLGAQPIPGGQPTPEATVTYCTTQPIPIEFVLRNEGVRPIVNPRYTISVQGNPNVIVDSITRTLAVGQTDTVRRTIVIGQGLTGRRVITVRAFAPSDNNVNNDLVEFPVRVGLLRSLGFAAVGGLTGITGGGYIATNRADGVFSGPGTTLWRNANEFITPTPTPTAALTLPTTGAIPGGRHYLVSPTFVPPGAVGVIWRMAITAGATGTTAVNPSDVGDDRLEVLYRRVCETTWQTLITYDQAAVAANAVSNTLRIMSVNLPASLAGDTVQIAFAVNDNGTTAPGAYTWHLNNLQVSSQPLSAGGPALAGTWHLYPNPTAGVLRLTGPGLETGRGRLTVRVVNALGQTIHAAPLSADGQHDLSGLPRGMHRVLVVGPGGAVVARLPLTLD